MPKLTVAPSPVGQKTFNRVKDSSIVNLKERLAKLRTNTSNP
jgi:hypothetical protein